MTKPKYEQHKAQLKTAPLKMHFKTSQKISVLLPQKS